MTSHWHLKHALAQAGLENFQLLLFKQLGSQEAVSAENLQFGEDAYLATIPNKYNFLTKAYTSLGYQHTEVTRQRLGRLRLGSKLREETKEKLRKRFSGHLNPFYGKQHPESFKEKLKQARLGPLNPMYGKEKFVSFQYHAHKPRRGAANPMSKPTLLVHVKTGEKRAFPSRMDAAKALGYKSHSSVSQALKKGFWLRGVWKIVETSKVLFLSMEEGEGA